MAILTPQGATEEAIVDWANAQVLHLAVAPISGFADLSLRSGVFLLSVLQTVAPGAVAAHLILPGETPDDRRCASRTPAQFRCSCDPSIWLVYGHYSCCN